ncbi:hypothetical protein ACSQ67_011837 [Phaseolus vulgaris]
MGCNKGSGSKTLRFRWRREPRLIQQLTLLGSGLESKSPGSDDKQIPLPRAVATVSVFPRRCLLVAMTLLKKSMSRTASSSVHQLTGKQLPKLASMILRLIFELEEALEVNPKNHETLSCLGNADISQAFLIPDQEEAYTSLPNLEERFPSTVGYVPFVPSHLN